MFTFGVVVFGVALGNILSAFVLEAFFSGEE